MKTDYFPILSTTVEATASETAVRVVEVCTPKHWRDFLDLPWSIYEGNPYWVPALESQVKDLLDPAKNPFFKHAQRRVFLAYREGKPVGRIAGIIDRTYNKYHNETSAVFGFFESVNSVEVARELFSAVQTWVTAQGINTLRGPYNPSSNHEAGLLVEGFEESPTLMLPYNPPYYAALLEACGFRKAHDMFAYDFDRSLTIPDNMLEHARRLREKHPEITFRDLDMKRFDAELDFILEVFNDSLDVQWDFVPMERAELNLLARDLKQFVDPKLFFMIEVSGERAGFAFALPDLNQGMLKIKKRDPHFVRLFKLWWHLKGPGRRKTVTRCRIVALGVKKKHRHLAMGPLFYIEFLRRSLAAGYKNGEASWVIEDNGPMNRGLRKLGGKVTKRYRIVEKTLS